MRKSLAIIGLALLLRIILAFGIWHPDLNNHIDWGIRFFQYGPAKFYAPESNVWSFTWPNQPPGTIYLFAGVRKVYEGLFGFFSFLHFKVGIFPGSILLFLEKTLYPALLKLPSILADFGVAYLLYKLTRKRLVVVLWLFNPVVWYNSAVWGQTDALINFLTLLGLYFLLNRKLFLAVLAIGVSLFTKVSLAIFLPLFVIVAVRQKYKFPQYIFSFSCCLVLILLLSLPFSRGNIFVWIYELYKNNILTQQLQIITANAFNLWSGIAGIHQLPQTLPFMGLTYQYWGYILFGISFIPILCSVYKKQDPETLVWAFALTAFSSWMFLTNMHERYLYPLFPFLTILAVWDLKLMPLYGLVSGINLLNLYNFWWVPMIKIVQDFLSLKNRLVPRILGFIDFGLFVDLYWYYYQKGLRHLKREKI